jgi:hypothetical protein
MSLHLNMSSMADRHLVIAYVIILCAQFGYAARTAWNLRKDKSSQ